MNWFDFALGFFIGGTLGAFWTAAWFMRLIQRQQRAQVRREKRAPGNYVSAHPEE